MKAINSRNAGQYNWGCHEVAGTGAAAGGPGASSSREHSNRDASIRREADKQQGLHGHQQQ
jgi:hypothetical protein